MGFFDTAGARLRVATVLASAVVGAGLFLAGSWAGATGTLPFGTATAPAAHGPNEPCCADMAKDHPGPAAPMPADMPMDTMGPKAGKGCCDKP